MSLADRLGQGPGSAAERDRLRRPGAARLVRGGRAGTWTLRSLAAPRRARSLAATRGAHSHSLRARLRGAMDAALLHSLLEANCSLSLAEELLLDGWGMPPDPEGRQERSGLATRGFALPRSPRAGLSSTPRRSRAIPLSSAALPPVTRSLLLLQHDLGPDRDLLAPEHARSPGGETVPRVLQWHQVQHDP